MKEIKNWPGYFITQDGQVWSEKSKRFLKFKDVNGYNKAQLYNKGIRKYFFVHRLVAEAYIPNPNNLPFINHKDQNRKNNTVENLEWCNAQYNNNYGDRIEKIKNKLTNNNHCKEIAMCDKNNGQIIKIFPSVNQAARYFNKSHSNIIATLKGRQKTCYGYKWIYIENQKDPL